MITCKYFFDVGLHRVTVFWGQWGLKRCIYVSALIQEHAFKGLLTALWLKSQRNLGAHNLDVFWMKLEELLQELNSHTPNTNGHSVHWARLVLIWSNSSEIQAAKTLALSTDHITLKTHFSWMYCPNKSKPDWTTMDFTACVMKK